MVSPNNLNSQFKPTNQSLNLDTSNFSTLSGGSSKEVRQDEPFDAADREGGFLDCETQVLDLGDETQLVDLDDMQDTELAGETQVMDDYDFIEKVDTQLVDLSYNETECRSYGESEGTQLLHDTEVQSDCDDQATSNAYDRTHNILDDGEATTESCPGQRKSSKNTDGESCSSEFRNESVNVEKVNVGHDIEQGNDERSSNEKKRKDDRSLVENILEGNSEERSCDRFGGQRTDTPLLSSCHEESAGLSYIDSQEPGEMLQANAIEFIDKFLKINVLESDQDKTVECAVVTPGTIPKGPQSLAQQTNRLSTITGAKVFDWDDALEDGGGGEFFIKKKKELTGTNCWAQKSSSKSQSSRRAEPAGVELARRHKNEEEKNMHKKVRQSIHSYSKPVKSKNISGLKKMKGRKEIDDNTDQLLASDCGDREVPDAELVDLTDVGIDTQLAAEAMEVLSTGRALLTVDSSVADEDKEIGQEMCEKANSKKGMQKKSSVGTRTTKPSTRSSHEEPECTIALRTRSKLAVEEFNGDLLKTKGNSRLDMKNVCDVNEQEPSGLEPIKIGEMRRANTLAQELLKTVCFPVKNRSSRVKTSSSASAACKTRQHVNENNLIETGDASGGSRVQRGCLHSEQVGRDKRKRGACSPSAKEGMLASAKSQEKAQKLSSPAIVTPINLKTPISVVSPICVGDEYSTPSCRKSLKKEFYRLTSTKSLSPSPCKDLRPRRDISSIRVLFSRHLDDDIIRQQKKIMSRLGVQEASSISDATHFVADSFVRTRNMLEAIANGKPVVTPLWLDCCRRSSCFIDEKNYILRDAKKERELGFSMPNSLARAIRHPLLEGRRVFITPNAKPGKEILTSLVKAVHGLAIERLCRSMSNKDGPPDDLLVLSCEEDFGDCVPLLEKGIAVYSSELLLNGIITQLMEYERHRIFVDHLKITRSTSWVKKNGERFLLVSKAK